MTDTPANRSFFVTKLFGSVMLIAVFLGCGGSSSSPSIPEIEDSPMPVAEVLTGVFIDSAVTGLRYETLSQSGMTDENGEFSYLSGESITFSLGDIVLPSIQAKEQISPLEVFATTDYYDTAVVNLARLLQTLDTDGNASNGINLAASLHTLAEGLDVDFYSEDFDTSVVNLVANSGGELVELINESQAINHLIVSLNSDADIASCDSTHEKVGHSGTFTTRFHGVTGKATIVNDCTIIVTNFSYDGEGPSVYFYGALNHAYSSDEAIRMGNLLNGTVFEGDTLVFNLPLGRSLDELNTLSVWCDAFNASFGDLQFSNQLN